MKTCSKCRQSLPENEFHKRKYKNGKIVCQPKCKECTREYRKKYNRPHSRTKYTLGLTWEEVEAISAPGACECCGSTYQLCIDHDHDTEKPRGLLCHKCNTALGLLDDDSQRMIKLIQYLERSTPLG